jgi:hypothetical protein
MGAFSISAGFLINENESGEFEGKVGQHVFKTFCF